MADVTITASNFIPVAGTPAEVGISGEAIDGGHFIRKHTDGKWYKSFGDSDVNCACDAMATSTVGAANQTFSFVRPPCTVAVGSVLVAGIPYAISITTAGRMR